MQIQLNRVLVTLAIIVVLLVANVSISMDAVLANTSEEVTEDVVENEEEQETTSETNQEETNDSENDEVKEETSEDTESSDKSSEEDVDEESSEVEEEEDKESEEATHSEEKENAEVTEETEEDTSTSKENTENETSEENTEDDTSSEDETEEPSTFSAEATTMQDTSWVTPFKEDLTRLGFGGMNINDTYGNFTAKRVGEFQAYYGLNVNKEADEATLAKLDDILSSPFQKGETHEDTIELKKLLTWLGYGNMNINEIYGSFTETRVQQFQRDHGLKDHGIADEPTWNKLREIVDTVFQVGNEHPGVVELKRNLTTLGFGNMNINEVYGNFTETRVRQFQANYGLSATGQVDQKTLKKIDELLKVSFYQGKTDSDVVSLKEGLTKVGFGNMNINEIYGNFTETRVSQFQDYYGLRATGVADPQTVEKLNQVVNSPFQEGETHENTIELKNLLTWLGYGNMNINEIYGSFTETRVRQFQRDHGLKDNGIADEQTWNLLSEMIDTVFQVGNEHPGVVELKRKLTTLGFGNMNINEVYGNFTETRVRQFQDYYGLRVTGVADYQTVELLYEIADSPFQEGETHDDTIELKRLLTWLGYGNNW
ncbi:Peptidoglycan-binding (PGRP) domain of peptidoglycan hydrolases-containing protein [Gracilibacillus orientalis]|uniref:Peptidoglycan-binding (PGRP) domain of peptidoglycan hydrolases-containing protein n=1 Tax=Gracilibacillus orientalis TaxID=334253 RepID=A0A1I4PH83_9BACI|nr:peptidoglycan-binding protein [Gracilibacillus orientalis]SFM27161.1 Peptidoglycan-binding (PGRP) domain of peptidoglycan hydrolases-containing protein [Gracilibacillus orientalis]